MIPFHSMAESGPAVEQPESEYNPEDHQDFIDNRQASLGNRAQRVLGYGLVGTGMVFALTGIGDFVSGGKVSELLMQTGTHNLPDVVTWASQHLAEMSTLMKTAGGASMIASGAALLNRSR